MPRAMLGRLPRELFKGKLYQNRLFVCCQGVCNLPPRLPLILALACQKAFFEVGEIVYNAHDEVANVFLVLSGTFAHVAHASPDGGRNYRGGGLDCRRINTSRAILETKRSMSSAALAEVHKILQPYSLFSHRSYFGEVEIFLDCMRKTTARCESQSGCLLVIHKSES